MGRSLQAYLVVPALLGMSGCLLFTDPINRAPEVTDVKADGEIIRGQQVGFTATFRDDQDSRALDVQWAVFAPDGNQSCTSITKASWEDPNLETTSLPSDLPYQFSAETLNVVCVCAMARDRRGASAFACDWVQARLAAPVATIMDLSGATSAKARPLCSRIHLVASPARDSFPKGDEVQYNWQLTYSGSDPVARPPQLLPCDEVKDTALADQHRCIDAQAPGTYTVSLSIVDKPKEATAGPLTSNTAEFVIPVLVDAPPCLQQTDPAVHAQRILLSRSTDLGSTYQSRTFEVLSVAGDCEQYPTVAGKQAPQFVWSVYDETTPKPEWAYQAYSGDSFPINQLTFPNALPGDEIKVRVEVRDQAVQDAYLNGIKACSADRPENLPDICRGANDCIRWTTWTVQFQP